MVRGLRFRPPRTPESAPLAWVLARAWGPLAATPAGPGDPGAALELARRLDLSARIAARTGAERLEAELDAEVATAMRRDRLGAAAVELGWLALAREVARAGAAAGVTVVFLKSMALRLAGRLEDGSRLASDLDVLVPAASAVAFVESLEDWGFRAGPGSGYEHHLPPLFSAAGMALEVHTRLLGVHLGRRRASAEVADLAAAGQLEPVAGFEGASFVPAPPVLAAHLLVHALAQHGWAPQAYPALRWIGDLADLGFPERTGPLAELVQHTRGALPAIEVEGAARLVRRLAAGDLSPLGESPGESVEASLLHHGLAGVLDPEYGPSLRFRDLGRPLTDRGRLAGLAVTLGRAVFPSATELEQIYGTRGGTLGRFGRRLVRPFDLAARAALYARSRWRLRRRDRGS
ncbi:MAG TPA: nucleotidyltransferase family protein [Thermoanaerobaculia bacterium]|nr:nucleotidyltransferase family protein [Thermoanaerobaculia bacterium]